VTPRSWRTAWDNDGYFIERGLIDPIVRQAVLARAWELVRTVTSASDSPVIIRYERGRSPSLGPEERVSKLYRLHRAEQAFRAAFEPAVITEALQVLIGPDVDLFLSQVVFKLPGALGQPWHQDDAIFPFEPPGPVVGVWCALTDAKNTSSRLGVQPGSHTMGQQPHNRDHSERTGGRYLALADREEITGDLLDLDAGDAVLFHSLLAHTSTDNCSGTTRVSITAHFAIAGTIDRTADRFGASPYNDWMPWLRKGELVVP
jgi:phytanoyl-CoA hydroxylase